MSMLIALDNGFQACMMAPTEILAAQHYETIRKFLFGMNVRVELLMGSVKGKKREKDFEGFAYRRYSDIDWNTCRTRRYGGFLLGMVVIDEQHRFWSSSACQIVDGKTLVRLMCL